MRLPYKHLFGPVPSRRLGRSLGVDLTPFKTCSFDCIFCQLGRTTRLTLDRVEDPPVEAVIAELRDWLDNGGTADYITLAGSGEPTLHANFGQVIEFVCGATSIPVALLSNGSLLADPEVRSQAAKANLVKVSLSAWDQTSLQQINRPHPGIDFERMVEGQRLFRKDFKGQLWLEVFLVWGTNSTASDVSRIAEWIRVIGPDKVQLNTAVRPPAEAFAVAVPRDLLEPLAALFSPPAEIAAEYSADHSSAVRTSEAAVLELLERRPCTLEQICLVFGLHRNEATKYLGKLTRTGRVHERRTNGMLHYAGTHGQERMN